MGIQRFSLIFTPQDSNACGVFLNNPSVHAIFEDCGGGNSFRQSMFPWRYEIYGGDFSILQPLQQIWGSIWFFWVLVWQYGHLESSTGVCEDDQYPGNYHLPRGMVFMAELSSSYRHSNTVGIFCWSIVGVTMLASENPLNHRFPRMLMQIATFCTYLQYVFYLDSLEVAPV